MPIMAARASWWPRPANEGRECLFTLPHRLILRWLVAWIRNQNMRIPTVIASSTKPAIRFSNQTRIRPIKAVRKGRNMYMNEFYRRCVFALKTSASKGLLYRMHPWTPPRLASTSTSTDPSPESPLTTLRHAMLLPGRCMKSSNAFAMT